MNLAFEGPARRFGDHVNTDYIISSRRKRDTLDTSILRQYLFEDIAPAFAASVRPGDLIVAGRNFGCGSAMEIAATVLLGAGIRAVIAISFSRTFYRNAFNNGLLPVQCDTESIQEGHLISLNLTDTSVQVTNITTGREIPAEPVSGIMLAILSAGGLVEYLRTHKKF